MGNSPIVNVQVAPTLTPTVVIFSLPNGIGYYYTQDILLKAILKDATGNPLSGRTITFMGLQPPMTMWGDIGTAVTNATGTAEYWDTVNRGPFGANLFGYAARFDGDATYDASASNIVNVTIQQMPTALSINVLPSSGKAPLTVTVTGTLIMDKPPGLPVSNRAIVLLVNGASAGTTTTDSNGKYTITVTLTTAGTFTLQTTYGGDLGYVGCEVKATAATDVPPPISLWKVGAIFASILGVGAALSLSKKRR